MATEPLKILEINVETGVVIEREMTEADREGWPILEEETATE